MKKKKLKIAVLGTQAAGKGTQARILSITNGVPAISIGNLLRDISNEDTDRGRMVKEHLSKGTFPAEDVVLPMLKAWLDKNPEGWVIDGFPRTMPQATKSAEFFKPDAVVSIDLPDEEARRRISYRRVCAKCKTNYNIITQPPKNSNGVCDIDGGELIKRADDTPDLVNERLKMYHELTVPVKEFFRPKGVLLEIDGRPGITEVAHEIEVRLRHLTEKGAKAKKNVLWAVVGVAIFVAVLVGFAYIGSKQ
jgi:adenylate kinase